MNVHRMMVIGLLATSSGTALASAGARYQDLGELQRLGEEGRGTSHHGIRVAQSALAAQTESELSLGTLQQRGEEGRGEGRLDMRAIAAPAHPVDLGDAQRRAQEGRSAPFPEDVASRK